MARPIGTHKLSKNVRENICKFIALGVSQESAAAQEGVSASQYWSWLRRGRAALAAAQQRARETLPDEGSGIANGAFVGLLERNDLPYAELAAEVDAALGKAEAGYTLKIAKASDRDWRAAAWWLEKRRPDLYGSREGAGTRLEHDPAVMSNEEIVSELNELGFVQASVVEAAPSALSAGTGTSPAPANQNASGGGDDQAETAA